MRKKLIIIQLSLALILLSGESISQPYSISRLGIEQGLSNSYVMSITQDRDGFLWFATEEGLNRFDGKRFTGYYKHTGSISANELNCICADPDEPVIWIGTQRAGLNAYNYETNTLTVYRHDEGDSGSIVTDDVTGIAPSADGNLWISTYRRGFDYFDKETGRFTHYNSSTLPGLDSENIWCVLDDGNGNVYIGHERQGMSVFSRVGKEVRRFRRDPGNPNSLPGNSVRCIYRDKNDNIWVGTSRGLVLFDPETGTFTPPPDETGLLSSRIFDIRHFDDNKLWIATELNGVLVLDLNRYPLKTDGGLVYRIAEGYNKYSVSNSTVRSIFQDSFQNIWIGTYGGGLNFIGHSEPFFKAYDYSPIADDRYGLNNKVVSSLCIDADHKLWAGTDGGGINVLYRGERIAVHDTGSGGVAHNSIPSVFRDSKGNLWAGSFLGGIHRFDRETGRTTIIGTEEGAYFVCCFFEDREGVIWAGSNTGIYLIDPRDGAILRKYDGSILPEEFVRSIGQDTRGNVWIGTFGRGMAVYTPDMKEIARYDEPGGFCSNMINHIYRDSENNMWVATNEGLVRFRNADLSRYDLFRREEGLNNNFIRAITEDAAGNIWFSTNAGISCRLRETGKFNNYTHLGGAPMGSFSNAAVAQGERIIYFGSINGVRYFDPVYVLGGINTPTAVITEVKIWEKHASQDESIDIHYSGRAERVDLDYYRNTFSVTFNVRDYSLAHQVDYSYRLKGLNDSWATVDDNEVVFRDIPPGRYEFEVRSRIRNLQWSGNAASLPIRIEPPVWLSWWAKTLYILSMFALSVFLSYLYKKRIDLQSSLDMAKKNYDQERELDNERLRFYTNIAHELRTPLTLILGPLEDLQKDMQLLPRHSKKIGVVRHSAIRLLNLINQILEFRKTETQNRKLIVGRGNIAALVKEIGLRYKELITKPGVEFSVSIEHDEMPLWFDREIVTIILDNLISNAVKFTDRGRIVVGVRTCTRQSISHTEITVEDTGSGIPPEEQLRIFERYYQMKGNKNVSGTGIGLALVKNMASMHEGEVRVESVPGKGSTFRFSLLTHNTYPGAIHDEAGLDPGAEAEEEELAAIETPGKPILLVVEDNPDISAYISESFAGSFDVVEASDGEEGLNKALLYMPDVIVSDIMMPLMNGIEFCGKIKKDIRTSHIPVILLTVKDSISDKEQGYASGADSYLTKPFSATLLHSRINNLLENRKNIADRLRKNIRMDDKSSILRESVNRLDDEFIDRLVKLIEDHMEQDRIDIAWLSERLFMSSSTLYRKMKALTGMSANEFIRKVRMHSAERLILKQEYHIGEIAYKVGINDPVYFRQCFKEEFGLTPSDYIKQLTSTLPVIR